MSSHLRQIDAGLAQPDGQLPFDGLHAPPAELQSPHDLYVIESELVKAADLPFGVIGNPGQELPYYFASA
jgi:hypothetical protein